METDDGARHGRGPHIKLYIALGFIPIVLAFAVFFLIVQRLGRNNYQTMIEYITGHFNFFQICLYIWMTDTFILPLSPMFVFPMVIQYPWYFAIPVTGLASALGGVSAYFMGRLLVKVPIINRGSVKAHEKWGATIEKYGVAFVLVASILPLPFSAVCMAAGVMKLDLVKVSLCCTTRILRMALYYFLFVLGLVAL